MCFRRGILRRVFIHCPMSLHSHESTTPGTEASSLQPVASFVEGWTKDRMATARALYENAGGASLPTDTLRALAVIPVALQEEPPEQVAHTLSLYSKQDMPSGTTGVFLYLNQRGSINRSQLNKVMDVVAGANQRFPQLAVAASAHAYDKPRPIGGIRSDAWDVGIWHLYANELQQEVTGLSGDADATWMNPSFISNIDHAARHLNEYASFGGVHYFEQVGDKQSPANRLMRYRWFIDRMRHNVTGMHIIWEGCQAFRMGTLATVEGWPEDSKGGEGVALHKKIVAAQLGQAVADNVLERTRQQYIVPDTKLVGSSRRHLTALQHGCLVGRKAHEAASFSTGGQSDEARIMSTDELARQITLKVEDATRIADEIDECYLKPKYFDTEAQLARIARGRDIARKLLALPAASQPISLGCR